MAIEIKVGLLLLQECKDAVTVGNALFDGCQF